MFIKCLLFASHFAQNQRYHMRKQHKRLSKKKISWKWGHTHEVAAVRVVFISDWRWCQWESSGVICEVCVRGRGDTPRRKPTTFSAYLCHPDKWLKRSRTVGFALYRKIKSILDLIQIFLPENNFWLFCWYWGGKRHVFWLTWVRS